MRYNSNVMLSVSQRDWPKFRLVMEGGSRFLERYLERYNDREKETQFENRKKLSYPTPDAKMEVLKVANTIEQRSCDVSRVYPKGLDETTKVDLLGNTLPMFMYKLILLELLSMGHVGVYIDKRKTGRLTLAEAENRENLPYLTMYRVEEIVASDSFTCPTNVLLQDWQPVMDVFGFQSGGIDKTRWLRRQKGPDGKVRTYVSYVDNTQKIGTTSIHEFIPTDAGTTLPNLPQLDAIDLATVETEVIPIKQFPFRIFSIRDSLLRAAADYQIAILNQESVDNWFAYRLGFPIYVEQGNFGVSGAGGLKDSEQNKEIRVGPFDGRGYPPGMDPPAFVSPDPESAADKRLHRADLRAQLKSIMLAAVESLSSAGPQTRLYSNSPYDAGLAAIAKVLEEVENWIFSVWSEFQGQDTKIPPVPNVNYPQTFGPMTDEERTTLSEGYLSKLDKFPSKKAKVQILKVAYAKLMGGRVPDADLIEAYKEFDNAKYFSSDSKTLTGDIENQLVTKETASLARGYEKGESEKAQKESLEQLKAIAASQGVMEGGAAGAANQDPSARGIPGASTTPDKDKKKAREEQGGGRAGTGDPEPDPGPKPEPKPKSKA